MKLNKDKEYKVRLEVLLLLTAYILDLILWTFWFIYAVVKYSRERDWTNLGYYLRKVSKAIDEKGNVKWWPFCNKYVRMEWGAKFWRSDETLSSVIGKNERDNTLKPMWIKANKILNIIDYNHSINSIEEFCEHND